MADHRKFVEVWQTSSSVEEVANKLDMERGACSRKAFYLRKHNVPLKTFRSRGTSTQFKELAEFATSLVPEV